MDSDNDFIQKYNNKGGKSNKIYTTILVSFITSIVGASCALIIFYNATLKNNALITTVNAPFEDNNTNLSCVSLTNYSDTAIYAANKILPSMVSISVEYEVNYMGVKQAASGSGSGVIISEDGYILTNNHVINSTGSTFYQVSDAKNIKVTICGDKTEYVAQVVGTDSQTDLAVLKIEKNGLCFADLGNSSSVQVGEFVLAVGDPYGLEHSVTAGIISALNRKMNVEGVEYTVMQADCAINSGNSGGALVNSQGQVIGITNMKLAGNGIEGVSFAIPIDAAVPIYKELIENGKISRPFVGISGIALDEATAIRNGLTKGIYVDSVISNSPAEKSGIKAGDVIVKFDGQDVLTMQELNEIKNTKNVGDKVDITLYRKNDEKSITITLGEV